MEILSLAGIFVGLALLMVLAYKGHSIVWIAPFCAFIVALFALGAGLGSVLSLALGLRAIWVSCGLLGIDCVLMCRRSLRV